MPPSRKQTSIESILASQVIDLEHIIRQLVDQNTPRLPSNHPIAPPALAADDGSKQRFADRLAVLHYGTRILLDGQQELSPPIEIRDSMKRLGPGDIYLQFCERVLTHVQPSEP